MPSLSLNLVDNDVHPIFPSIEEITKHFVCSCVRQWLQFATMISLTNAYVSTSFMPTSCSRAIVLSAIQVKTTVYHRSDRIVQLE